MVTLPSGLAVAYLQHHRVCPSGYTDDGMLRLLVAPDALLDDSVPELARVFATTVLTVPVDWATVHSALQEYGTTVDTSEAGDELAADLRDLARQPPVVRYVNTLIREAMDQGASDVHLEAASEGAVTRFRVDGVLSAANAPPPEHRDAVISRIKLLSDLDIAEHRRPQDGRIRVRLASRELDLRVSIVPTLHGESVVLRLLEPHGRPTHLQDLGLSEEIHSRFLALARRPHGLLLVTGPTGAGKTTTLYAALHCRNLRTEKLITVEDPIEYRLADIAQVPVHRAAGVTFASALRSILRQDPDVLMVGEMRDTETAEVAVQAAMTGHLVLSTLHTIDAVAAVPRMLDLGVAAYLVAATLDGVLAQRLVRRNCKHCVEPVEASAELLEGILPEGGVRAGDLVVYRGRGCEHCGGTGYRGRVGIFELLVVSEALRDAIAHGAGRTVMREVAKHDRPVTLAADGLSKVLARETTLEEVHRAVHT